MDFGTKQVISKELLADNLVCRENGVFKKQGHKWSDGAINPNVKILFKMVGFMNEEKYHRIFIRLGRAPGQQRHLQQITNTLAEQ